MDSWWETAVWQRELNLMFCDDVYSGLKLKPEETKEWLAFIVNQQTEIERLQCEVTEKTDWIRFLKNQVVDWKNDYCKLKETLNSAKSEARREFAERLKEIAWIGLWETVKHVDIDEIDEILKEMEG